VLVAGVLVTSLPAARRPAGPRVGATPDTREAATPEVTRGETSALPQ
jgi:hypothetical protein